MFGFLSSNSRTLRFRKNSTKRSRYVDIDDFDVKSKNGVVRDATKPVYWGMKHANTYESKNISSSMRVKVVMTKEEAIMLLSKCDNGGTLSFQDVTMELRQIPASRVSLVHPCNNPHKELVLESIPEEH